MTMKSSYLSILSPLNQHELVAMTGIKPNKSMLLSFALTALERGLRNYVYTEVESKDQVFTPNVVHKAPETKESAASTPETGLYT